MPIIKYKSSLAVEVENVEAIIDRIEHKSSQVDALFISLDHFYVYIYMFCLDVILHKSFPLLQ